MLYRSPNSLYPDESLAGGSLGGQGVGMRMGGRVARGRRSRWCTPPVDLRAVAAVERATVPAGVLDPNGMLVAANRPLEELLGVGLGGLLGRSLGSLAHPGDVDAVRGALAAVLGRGADRHLVEARCVRLDDQQLVWGAFDLSPVRDQRGRARLAVAVVRDLTEALRAEHERRFLEFLLASLGEGDDGDAMLAAAVQTICQVTRCALGQAWVPDGGVLVCGGPSYASRYGFEALRSASERLGYQRGAGLPGLVWATGRPCLVEGADDPARFDRAAAARRAGVAEVIAVPVETSSGLLAVLEFFVAAERTGEAGRLQRISRAAAELGPVLDRKRAEAALAAANRELQRANAELEALLRTAAHELHGPLGALLGDLEELRLGHAAALGERANDNLGRIAERARLVQRLVGDLAERPRGRRLAGGSVGVDRGDRRALV
jgi:PAS domain S-box-containing protein